MLLHVLTKIKWGARRTSLGAGDKVHPAAGWELADINLVLIKMLTVVPKQLSLGDSAGQSSHFTHSVLTGILNLPS